jgi:hypothetical protein
MDREQKYHLAELAAHIAKESDTTPGPASAIAIQLVGISTRLQHYHETQCNYGLTDKQERRIETLRKKAKSLIDALGWKVNHFNSDPRGYSIYVDLPSGRYNTMGGKENGYGI